jgi:hypothetical protein
MGEEKSSQKISLKDDMGRFVVVQVIGQTAFGNKTTPIGWQIGNEGLIWRTKF